MLQSPVEVSIKSFARNVKGDMQYLWHAVELTVDTKHLFLLLIFQVLA